LYHEERSRSLRKNVSTKLKNSERTMGQTVKTCHHECPISNQSAHLKIIRSLPSIKKAAGHPTTFFHFVSVLQKILSKFQIKNPNAKRAAPVLNKPKASSLLLLGIELAKGDMLVK
jgi:hypothetical protein